MSFRLKNVRRVFHEFGFMTSENNKSIYPTCISKHGSLESQTILKSHTRKRSCSGFKGTSFPLRRKVPSKVYKLLLGISDLTTPSTIEICSGETSIEVSDNPCLIFKFVSLLK